MQPIEEEMQPMEEVEDVSAFEAEMRDVFPVQ